jgi:hypothetical protein
MIMPPSELNYSYAGGIATGPNQSVRFVSINLQITMRQKRVRRSNCKQDIEQPCSYVGAVKRLQLLCACVIWLSITTTASAQDANHNRDFDPLHQFNTAVRKLVSQVTPAVVQLLATGYGPVESGSGNSSLLVGMQQKIGSGVIIDPDGDE